MTDGRTDGRTDRRTDGGDCNIPDAFLKKCGDNQRICTSAGDNRQNNKFNRIYVVTLLCL